MSQTILRITDDDLATYAKTIYGEARGEPLSGQIAVAWVIKNRVLSPRWWGKDIKSVCLAKLQFSCWNQDDPNLPKLQNLQLPNPEYSRALGVASLVSISDFPDLTFGATSYYNPAVVDPPWAGAMVITLRLGNHVFLKEKK